MTRRGFILDDVSTLKPARAVHRRKPAADVTQETQRSSDERRAQLAPFVWFGAEIAQHLPDQLAMMPFFFFDLFYSRALVRVAK